MFSSNIEFNRRIASLQSLSKQGRLAWVIVILAILFLATFKIVGLSAYAFRNF